MWPLVVSLLLGSWCCGSAQLFFHKIESVEFNSCNKTVLIPCFISNIAAEQLGDLYVKWKFQGQVIFVYDGAMNRTSADDNFLSAEINLSELLKGNAALKLDFHEAEVGLYTCEVTELIREGVTTVELKYRGGSWFSLKENVLIIIFPLLAVILFWIQVGVLMQRYRSNPVIKKIIILCIAGFMLTLFVIVGAILFIPGNYSRKKSYGLIFFVTPSVLLLFLHYYKFKPLIGHAYHALAILTVSQVLGYILVLTGLYLCITVCVPKYGPLLISGLGIIAVVELLALVYMKYFEELQSGAEGTDFTVSNVKSREADQCMPASLPELISLSYALPSDRAHNGYAFPLQPNKRRTLTGLPGSISQMSSCHHKDA